MELIETLWNVNVLPIPGRRFPDCELIETLWNVNKKSEAEKKRQVKN